jgi:large subunit ribosomal protein L32
MAVPKRKVSKSRIRSRHASHRHPIQAVQACPECGAPQQLHRVCSACGKYRGRQVLTVSAD